MKYRSKETINQGRQPNILTNAARRIHQNDKLLENLTMTATTAAAAAVVVVVVAVVVVVLAAAAAAVVVVVVVV